MVASTWWSGDCLTSSRLPLTPPSEVYPYRRQMVSSAGADGGMPPGTSASSHFPTHVGTSPGVLLYVTWYQCSRHACSEHCPYYSVRDGSGGRRSAPRPLVAVLLPGRFFLLAPAGVAFVLFTARPEYMRGSSRMCEGVKVFPAKSATPSRRSL